MSTTDTPRTDAIDYVPVRFWRAHADDLACNSRQLERELNASKAEVERLTDALKSCWHAANTYDANYTRACDNVMKISSEALSPTIK